MSSVEECLDDYAEIKSKIVSSELVDGHTEYRIQCSR